MHFATNASICGEDIHFLGIQKLQLDFTYPMDNNQTHFIINYQ
jgi:hypothetical protein